MAGSNAATLPIRFVQASRVDPSPSCRHRRDIHECRAEQRKCNADTAEDEIFPRGFERLVGPVQTNHHDGVNRRKFHGDHMMPMLFATSARFMPNIMIWNIACKNGCVWMSSGGVDFVPDIRRAEDARRKTDEGIDAMKTMLRSSMNNSASGAGFAIRNDNAPPNVSSAATELISAEAR